MTAELPGIQEKDIEISASEDSLQIKATRELTKEERENGFIIKERSYGSFYRSIPFGCPIDEDQIKANLKDGVLKIAVPKAAEAVKKQKKIPLSK